MDQDDDIPEDQTKEKDLTFLTDLSPDLEADDSEISELKDSYTASSELDIGHLGTGDYSAVENEVESAIALGESIAPPLSAVESVASKVPTGKIEVPAAYPFDLRITGPLDAFTRSKLLDLVSKEQLGVTKKDLELQFESGRVFFPRISEYAGVLIIQILRDPNLKIHFAPTAADDDQLAVEGEGIEIAEHYSEHSHHPAEAIPLMAGPGTSEMHHWQIIDAVTASASMKSNAVEARTDPAYDALVKQLQLMLKYQAYAKGAQAVVQFQITLAPLASPTQYRIMAMGTAIRPV